MEDGTRQDGNEFTTVTNPLWGTNGARSNAMQQENAIEATKANPTMNLKRGGGTGAIAAASAGTNVALYAFLMSLVSKGTISPTTAGIIQCLFAGGAAVGLSAADYERVGAAMGGGGLALGGGLLVEQLRLMIQQRRMAASTTRQPANTTQNPASSPPASSPNVSGGAGLGGGRRANFGPGGRQGAFAGQRVG